MRSLFGWGQFDKPLSKAADSALYIAELVLWDLRKLSSDSHPTWIRKAEADTTMEGHELMLIRHMMAHWKKRAEWLESDDHINTISDLGLFANSGDIPDMKLENYHDVLRSMFSTAFRNEVELQAAKSIRGVYELGKRMVVSQVDEAFADSGAESATKFVHVLSPVGKGCNFWTPTRVTRAWYDLTEIDLETIRTMDDEFLYWVGGYYDAELSGLINGMANGIATLGLGQEELAKRLATKLADKFPQWGQNYFTTLASAVLNTSRNFGNGRQMAEYGISTYEFIAILDDNTTTICRDTNGKIFRVSRLISVINETMAATTPEEIKTLRPYLQYDDEEGHSYYTDAYSGDRIDLPPAKHPDYTDTMEQVGALMAPLHYRCRSTQAVSEESIREVLAA